MKLCYVICLSALYICAIWTHEILKKTRFTMKRNMRYRTNVTILNELAGRNTDCVRACVNTPGCISANLLGGNAFERRECQLIGSYDVNDLEVDQQSDFICKYFSLYCLIIMNLYRFKLSFCSTLIKPCVLELIMHVFM